MDNKTKKEIQTIFDDWQTEVGLALTLNAEDIAYMSASTTLKEIAAMRQTEYTKAFADGVTDDIVKTYEAGIKKGGSWCVQPVFEDLGDGTTRCTTERVFVPWLDDFSEQQRRDVMGIFIEGERAGVYPLDMADDITKMFEGTKHRSVVAARTESQKIAQTARIESYKKSDVKYMQYITAGDENVRPEHEARNMKVYPIAKAPWIGEYQCRCILTEADFLVEEEGYPVETDDAEIIDNDTLYGKKKVDEVKQPEPKAKKTPEKVTTPGMPSKDTSWIDRTDLTQFERDSVYNYTNYGYTDMNTLLRTGAQEGILSETKDNIRGLDEAFMKSYLAKDYKVVRGLQGRGKQQVLDALESGKTTFTDKGYTSWSYDLKTSLKTFTDGGEGKRVVLINNLKKGDNAMFVGNSHKLTMQESEIILPHGKEFNIIGSKEFTRQGMDFIGVFVEAV